MTDAKRVEWEACGRGICAAEDGHAGTCAEASGWAVDGEPERDALRGVIGGVLCNASNFPAKVGVHILGRDMGPLIDRTVNSILAAGYTKPETVFVCNADGEGGHDMPADEFRAIADRNIIDRLRAELEAAQPRTVTTIEELGALPVNTVVFADEIAYQKCDVRTWDGLGRCWGSSQIDLPALVWFTPAVTQ